MKRVTSMLILLLFVQLSNAQDVSKRISYMIPFLDKVPNDKNIQKIEESLTSKDTLELSLAMSILFKYDTLQYKEQMMDLFEIPYKNWKFSKDKGIPTKSEAQKIRTQMAKAIRADYDLKEKEIEGIWMLYTFLVYRKHNVWEWKSENFAIPITTAIRGGYLRSLLSDSMDYKKFISDMMARNKARSTKESE